MVNYVFVIIARDKSNQEIVFKATMIEWHKLLFTVCPNHSASTRKFKFIREEVLTDQEIDLLEGISLDKDAVSISEGYVEYEEPNFEIAYKWSNIFRKIETEYFKTEKDTLANLIIESQNNEKVILKIIQRVRTNQFSFNQIKQTLSIAEENNLEIAFTISDY